MTQKRTNHNCSTSDCQDVGADILGSRFGQQPSLQQDLSPVHEQARKVARMTPAEFMTDLFRGMCGHILLDDDDLNAIDEGYSPPEIIGGKIMSYLDDYMALERCKTEAIQELAKSAAAGTEAAERQAADVHLLLKALVGDTQFVVSPHVRDLHDLVLIAGEIRDELKKKRNTASPSTGSGGGPPARRHGTPSRGARELKSYQENQNKPTEGGAQ